MPEAYGPLGLLPDQFDGLQPHEFLDLLSGYKWRRDQAEEMQAYFTAQAMSVHTKRPVQAKDLLKPLRLSKKQRNKRDDEQYLREKFNLPGGE